MHVLFWSPIFQGRMQIVSFAARHLTTESSFGAYETCKRRWLCLETRKTRFYQENLTSVPFCAILVLSLIRATRSKLKAAINKHPKVFSFYSSILSSMFSCTAQNYRIYNYKYNRTHTLNSSLYKCHQVPQSQLCPLWQKGEPVCSRPAHRGSPLQPVIFWSIGNTFHSYHIISYMYFTPTKSKSP